MMTCKACRHPDRKAIDKALAEGQTERSIAQQFKVSHHSVHRHREHLTTSITESDKAKALRALDHAQWHVGNLRKICEDCIPTPRQYLLASQEFTRAVMALARIAGDIKSDQVNVFLMSLGVRSEDEARARIEAGRLPDQVSDDMAIHEARDVLKRHLPRCPHLIPDVRADLDRLSYAHEVPTNGNGLHPGGQHAQEGT